MLWTGEVSSIEGNRARVIFRDLDGKISEPLPVLYNYPETVSCFCHNCGITTVDIPRWMPHVGQYVVCLFRGSDGFILGGYG